MLKLCLAVLLLCAASVASAQTGIPILSAVQGTEGATEYSVTLQLLALMTVLTLLPSLLLMMTSFTRIIIVLSLLRQALGTAQTPPNQVLLGIALFLTIFVMTPVFSEVYEDALKLPPIWSVQGQSNFFLGTDDLGRDILSRLIYGSRVSIFIGFFVVFLSLPCGI